jgi:glycerophosphoryl diester phosphodiesterase
VFAHRGASARAPENTLEAFRLAREEGAPYLEMDLRLSADGHVAVFHDESVARTTDGRGRIGEMTLDEIRRLDAGHRFTPDRGRTFPFRGRGVGVPTLDEALEAFPDARLNVEIKCPAEGIAQAVASTIRRHAASHRVAVAARDHAVLERFRTIDPATPTGFSEREVREFLTRARRREWSGYRPAGSALQVPERYGLRRIVSPAVIEAAHRVGIEVHVWTVNEPRRIRRLLDWGVDGVVTDHPARALQVLRAVERERG